MRDGWSLRSNLPVVPVGDSTSLPPNEGLSVLRRSGLHRTIISLLMVGLLASITALPALATPAPPQVRDFGPEIDRYASYEGQTRCIGTEQPGVRYFRAMLQRTYGANGGGILRGCGRGGRSEHKEGRAYDWMINAHNSRQRAIADGFLAWLLATDEHGNQHAMARRFGIMYIIWNGRSWSAWRAGSGWRRYTGSNPHTDHVHFSFSWDGARQRTSYWTAPHYAPEPPGPFSDVALTHHFVDEITWSADHDIVTGRNDGSFAPGDPVTRAQAVALLHRLLDAPRSSHDHGFGDVGDGAYYAPALRWMAEQGIVSGVREGVFAPDDPVTRGQFAAMLFAVAGRPGGDPSPPFADVTPSQHYYHAVAWLVARGITQGVTPTEFGGSERISRAQAVVFLHRLTHTELAWQNAEVVPSLASTSTS